MNFFPIYMTDALWNGDGVTKHCTSLTDRTGSKSYHTGIRSPHRRLKRPLRAWRQLQTIGRCLRIRVSGRFKRRCGNFLPVLPWDRCGVSPHPNGDIALEMFLLYCGFLIITRLAMTASTHDHICIYFVLQPQEW